MNIDTASLKAAELAMTLPGQIRKGEAQFLYKLARQKSPIVEIGALHGRSTSVLVQAAQVYDAPMTTVDPFVATPNTEAPSSTKWQTNLASVDLAAPRLINKLSHDAIKDFTGEIGFLFIDGGHTYEQIVQDIHDWVPRVKMNGIVAYHDFFQPAIPGVAQAVSEWWCREFTNNLANWRMISLVDFTIAFRRVA